MLQEIGEPHLVVANVGAQAHVGGDGHAGRLPVLGQRRPVGEVRAGIN